MEVFDMLWAKHPEYFDGGLIVKIKNDAPEEIKRSFENYLKQSKEKYGRKRKPTH